jgi:hypothetical protein
MCGCLKNVSLFGKCVVVWGKKKGKKKREKKEGKKRKGKKERKKSGSTNAHPGGYETDSSSNLLIELRGETVQMNRNAGKGHWERRAKEKKTASRVPIQMNRNAEVITEGR